MSGWGVLRNSTDKMTQSFPNLLTITPTECQALQRSGQIIEGSEQKPRVVLTAQGQVRKFFYARKKPFYSSSHRRPYALRFWKNAQCLEARGVLCPIVEAAWYEPEAKIYILGYPYLDGQDLRQCLAVSEEASAIHHRVIDFLAALHAEGVFFRSIHLGNLLITPAGTLGLLDIGDLSVKRRTLSPELRGRNLAHLLCYQTTDARLFAQYGVDAWIDQYLARAQLSKFQKNRFLWWFRKSINRNRRL